MNFSELDLTNVDHAVVDILEGGPIPGTRRVTPQIALAVSVASFNAVVANGFKLENVKLVFNDHSIREITESSFTAKIEVPQVKQVAAKVETPVPVTDVLAADEVVTDEVIYENVLDTVVVDDEQNIVRIVVQSAEFYEEAKLEDLRDFFEVILPTLPDEASTEFSPKITKKKLLDLIGTYVINK